jgi:S-adenosylmethionine hydrolase
VTVRRVTLLTDFGTADGYAAAMAGVIAATAPGTCIDHASHAVPQGDVLAAGLALVRYAYLYPEGTVHLVVVDPGVGTDRRALAAAIDGRFFVAPDNGVLTRVLQRDAPASIVGLADPAFEGPVSATFHGRDIFAPAAARLARGEPLDRLGETLTDTDIIRLPLPVPSRSAGRVRGEIVQVDRFGNLITNIPAMWLPAPGAGIVAVGGSSVGPVRRTYGDVERGELLALVGSIDVLEISVRDGSAAARLEADRGAEVTVEV